MKNSKIILTLDQTILNDSRKTNIREREKSNDHTKDMKHLFTQVKVENFPNMEKKSLVYR